jgi:hypothetical protein
MRTTQPMDVIEALAPRSFTHPTTSLFPRAIMSNRTGMESLRIYGVVIGHRTNGT